jgi:hypothetical protein
MSQRFDHKKLQDNLNAQQTQKLESGDMSTASRLSESVSPQEFLSDSEKKSVLEEIQIYFPNLKKDNKVQIAKKINDLLDFVTNLVESKVFTRDSILEAGYQFNDLVKELPYGLPTVVYSKVEKIRKLLNPQLKLAVKEIRAEYNIILSEIERARFTEELKNSVLILEDIVNLKHSIYDSLALEDSLYDTIISKMYYSFSHESSSKYKFLEIHHSELLQRFNGLLSLIHEELRTFSKNYTLNPDDINNIRRLSQNRIKIHPHKMKSFIKKVKDIEQILEAQPNLILPIRNRYIKLLELYNSAISNSEKQ